MYGKKMFIYCETRIPAQINGENEGNDLDVTVTCTNMITQLIVDSFNQ